MDIIDAIRDENLIRPFLQDRNGDLDTWGGWLTCLKMLIGRPVPKSRYDFVRQVTGRDPEKLPAEGFDTALFLTGRRSGKSRIAAVIGAYEASLGGHEGKLSPGERGVIPVISPSKQQSRIVRDYMKAIFETPLLRSEVAGETASGFELKNGTRIEILAGDFRTIRGYTLLAAIVDEAAFFGFDADAKVKSDTELIRALKPALATTGGKLIAISSPWAPKGWTYTTYRKNFGNDDGKTLVINAPSRLMNVTLPQSVIDEALAEDLQAAKSEYMGEFRDDVAEFLPRAIIERLVVPGRKQLMRQDSVRMYTAFVDMSGGRGDDAALAIAHREGSTIVLDALHRYKPPFEPRKVIQLMTDQCRKYNVRKVTGDNYAAEFCSAAFTLCGMFYVRSDLAKTALYQELLPRITSGEIELLDDPVLINQLAGLERRVRAGGKDVIDHPPNGHDDLANAVAGVAVVAAANLWKVGAFF